MTLSVIRDAHLAGDFELCLSMCDTFAHRDSKDAVEIALLRARCLIALGRGDHALEVLRGLRLHYSARAEYLTYRMLMSAAYVALGNYDEALTIAREAYKNLGDSYSAVGAELALNLAIAHYRKGEYAKASRLLDAIPESEDIVYVRALQFRGGLAWVHRDFAGSLDKFRDAFAYLDRCRYHDRFTEAKLLFSLAYLCGELPRLDLWPEVSRRIDRFDWAVSGVAVWRFWIAIEGSFITEMLGDLSASTAWAREAERVAPDPASLIVAWCRLAARFGRNGEKGAHEYFVDKALLKYDECSSDARVKEYKTLSLDIAEEVLYSDSPLAASRLVTYFAEAVAPSLLSSGDEGRQIEADYALIQGHLEDRRGNRGRAMEFYKLALEIYRGAGLMRRASVVAYRLFVLSNDRQYSTFIMEELPSASERYWIKARLAQSQTEARLTARQLAAVRLVAQGLSDKEIGAVLGVSYSRARNVVAEIRGLLGVRSRTELATVAAARGLLRPEIARSATQVLARDHNST